MNILKKNIAFDFDDSIADTWPVMKNVIYEHTGNHMEKPIIFDLVNCGFKEEDKNYIITESLKRWEDIQPYEGVVDFMKLLYNNTKKPIHIITFRAKYVEPEYTYNWLDKHLDGIPYFVSFAVDSKIDSIIKHNVEIMIDDQPKIIRNIYSYCEKIFVFDQPWNRMLKEDDKLVRFNSWYDMVNIIYKDIHCTQTQD